MYKKTLLSCIVVIVSLLIGPVVQARGGPPPKPEKIRVTYVKLPLNVPIIIVKHFAMLEKEFKRDDIEIDWPEITSGGKQTQALAAGSIDVASVVSSTASITARANGVDLKVVAVFARAPRAFNIMAKDPEIRIVKDLMGKKVAGPKGSLLNQTLFAALARHGLRPEDIGYVHMGVPKAMAALMGGSVDAALLAGPFVPRAESQEARVIANGEGLVKGLIVTAVKESFLGNHGELVRRYLGVQRQALEFMKSEPEATYDIVAEETGLSNEDVKRMYSWYDFDPSIKPSDIADLIATQDFLVESGMLEKQTTMDALVEDMTK